MLSRALTRSVLKPRAQVYHYAGMLITAGAAVLSAPAMTPKRVLIYRRQMTGTGFINTVRQVMTFLDNKLTALPDNGDLYLHFRHIALSRSAAFHF